MQHCGLVVPPVRRVELIHAQQVRRLLYLVAEVLVLEAQAHVLLLQVLSLPLVLALLQGGAQMLQLLAEALLLALGGGLVADQLLDEAVFVGQLVERLADLVEALLDEPLGEATIDEALVLPVVGVIVRALAVGGPPGAASVSKGVSARLLAPIRARYKLPLRLCAGERLEVVQGRVKIPRWVCTRGLAQPGTLLCICLARFYPRRRCQPSLRGAPLVQLLRLLQLRRDLVDDRCDLLPLDPVRRLRPSQRRVAVALGRRPVPLRLLLVPALLLHRCLLRRCFGARAGQAELDHALDRGWTHDVVVLDDARARLREGLLLKVQRVLGLVFVHALLVFPQSSPLGYRRRLASLGPTALRRLLHLPRSDDLRACHGHWLQLEDRVGLLLADLVEVAGRVVPVPLCRAVLGQAIGRGLRLDG